MMWYRSLRHCVSLLACLGRQNWNNWDRLPFITDSTGTASTAVLPTTMHKNFVISNYASTWPLDHDDGTRSAVT